MTRILRMASLRAKVTGIIILISTLAIVVAISAFLLYQNRLQRMEIARDIDAMAHLIGNDNAAALLFDDPIGAVENLSTLAARGDITEVHLYDASGVHFAAYPASKADARPPLTREHEILWRENHAEMTHPILRENQTIGYVQLFYSLDALHDSANIIFVAGLVIVLGTSLFSITLSAAAGGALMRPVAALAASMREVTAKHDYSLRTERTSEDELGDLVAGFNHMLAEIQARHRELNAYKEGLETLVAERTSELEQANRKLVVAVNRLANEKQKAEGANRAKSQFLANMSHELRTPLNAIIGFSDIMKEEMFGPMGMPKYREYAKLVHSGGQHLLAIVNDVLDMSRIEVGKIELSDDQVELKSLFDEVQKMMSFAAQKKRIALVVGRLEAGAPLVRCDRLRLRQVLLNLMGNAVKFTPEGGTIRIDTEFPDTGGVKIAVTDTGVGIPEDQLAHVMEPFGQVEEAYTREHGGAGLGLPISKALIEQHAGTLTLASTRGIGTTLTIFFPEERIERAGAAQAPVTETKAAVG